MRTLILMLVLAISGCCWLAKRDCFPPCPPQEVVPVEKTCELPPPVKLEAVVRAECASNQVLACFAPSEAAKLARNLVELKTWIKETRARCGAPSSMPSDAGILPVADH